MLASPLLLILVALADPPSDPTKPALVALDFPDRPVPEVIAALSSRSGNAINSQFWNNNGAAAKVTLRSDKPVPFWEAVDRLCADLKIQRALNDPNGINAREASLALYAPGTARELDPALYVGPFRLGKFALHANSRTFFVPPTPGLPDSVESEYRAEFEVLPEPRVLALRTGPLEKLEATDDLGRSLLDPNLTDPNRVSGPLGSYNLAAFQSTVRVRLARPEPDAKRLKTLKGIMPVEVGLPPKQPTATIPLAESIGKTVRAGDLAVTIEGFQRQPNGLSSLRVLVKIEGARAPGDSVPKPLSWARAAAIPRCLEVVDADGRPVPSNSGGTSGGEELRANYTFGASRGFGPPPGVPKAFRVYAPEWVRWDVPFEFHDLPLP